MLDYIVVGAGVAGCRIARHLEEMGKDYVVVEARKEPGIKDSGIVSERIFSLYEGIPLKAREGKMVIRGREKESRVSIPGGVFVMERERFGREIRKGIEISYDRISCIRKIGRGYELCGREKYRARRVVAADGTSSTIRSLLGIKPPPFIPASFWFHGRGKGIEVLFDKSISRHFFAWRSLNEYGLADFSLAVGMERLASKFSLPGPERVYSGLIPVMSIWPLHGNVALLGDAAGMTKPVTGGGIIYSTLAADMLGELIRDGKWHMFGRRWMARFWKEQMAGYAFRRIYPHLPQAAVDMLVSMLDFERGEFDYDFLTTFALQLLKKPFKSLWGS